MLQNFWSSTRSAHFFIASNYLKIEKIGAAPTGQREFEREDRLLKDAETKAQDALEKTKMSVTNAERDAKQQLAGEERAKVRMPDGSR